MTKTILHSFFETQCTVHNEV